MKRGRPPLPSGASSKRQRSCSAGVGGFSSSSPSPDPAATPSTPSTGLGESSGGEENPVTPKSGKRKWTSKVWKEYDCYDGFQFNDGKDRAYCKYCKGGPVLADSAQGTTNFSRHTKSCRSRDVGDLRQMLVDKGGKLLKSEMDNTVYKELVALAIIRHGYPFTFAEHEGNRDIHVYLNENVKCFTRNTAKKYCLQVHTKEKKKLKMSLSKVSSRICLTSDLWSSIVGQGYLSLTAHYIDDEWELHSKIISFCHVPPPHNANAIHNKILSLIKHWDIHKKVFSITLDNAKYNDNMQDMLADSLAVLSPLPANGDYFHIRCGAHILNLIVQEGLKFIGDACLKIRNLVKYVTGSEARKIKFADCAHSSHIDTSKGLWLDCPTRWNSSYRMLERALIYRPAFVKMKRVEKDLAPPIPTEDEWLKIEKISALLKPFDDITTKFSGRNYPTANIYFPNVWRIETLLKSYCDSEDETLKDMAKMMKGKFAKYWKSYSVVLSFAVILDPRYKMHLVEYCFDQLEPGNGALKAKQVKDALYKLFGEYTQSSMTREYEVCQAPIEGLAGFSSYTSVARNFSQLDLYLEESKLDHNMELDVLEWWKTNEKRLPEVARMAKDILSIPISTVASESSFSLGGRILTKWRASLKPENAEALVTTRSWVFGYQVDKDDDSLDDGVELHVRRYEDREENEGEDDFADSDCEEVEEEMFM